MKILSLFILCLCPLFIFGQWEKSANSLNARLFDIQSDNTGLMYTVGTDTFNLLENSNGIILKSDDGGVSWDKVYEYSDPLMSTVMTSVYLVDANTALVSNYDSKIFATGDQGNSWNVHTYPASAPFTTNTIHYFNENEWLLGNWAGEIVKTYDGGSTWTQVYFGGTTPFLPVYDISCPNDSVCYASMNGPYSIMKSTDAGETWNSLTSSTDVFGSEGIHAINNDTVIAVSGAFPIYRTIDGGNSWDSIPCPINGYYNLKDVHFVDNIGYAVGQFESILKSVDYGESWTIDNYNNASSDIITGVHMTNNGTAVACSDSGYIYINSDFTSIAEFELSTDHLSLFPNPIESLVHVKFASPQSGYITVSDLLGRTLHTQRFEEEELIPVNIDIPSSNQFLVRIHNEKNGREYVRKICKIK